MKVLTTLFFSLFLFVVIYSSFARAENLLPNPSFEGRTWQTDENNTNFEDWEISKYFHNGIIKTWVETANIHSGSKAFHWRTEAPDPTNISFSYYSNISKKFTINESSYLEAGLWSYVIVGSTGADITLHFWNETGGYLGRFWGQEKLGDWNTNEWKRVSYLWYPSSMGSGRGYIPVGAKYARLHIFANWHTPGIRERIDDDVFVKEYDHFPTWIERLDKNTTNISVIVDYNKFQGISNLSYGAHISSWMDFLTGGPNQVLWDKVEKFNFTYMRFQYPGFESCKYWNETTNSCDDRITYFEDWDISEYQHNGIIKTWLETTNVKFGNKAFHHYSEAPDPTELSFSYYSVLFPVNESKYYEAGFWSYPIQGTRAYDVTLHFYDANKNKLARRWGRDNLGSFQLNSWNRTSSLWYPSSLGQGNGYVENGAKYAKLNIYINWHVSGIKEAIDDGVFVREFDHLPTTEERKTEPTENLVANPSFEEATSVGYDWTKLDQAIEAIKTVGAEPVIALPIGTWGNGNYLPEGMPLNYSLSHGGPAAGGIGYFPTLETYCEYVKAIVNHTNVEKSYNVKYWEIGNEPNVCNSTIASAYIDYFNSAGNCMHEIDPTILLTSDRSIYRNFTDEYFIDYAQNVSFLSFHNYDSWGTCMYPHNSSNVNNIFYLPNNKNGWDTDENIMLKVNQLSDSCTGCWCKYSPKELHDLWKQNKGKDLEIIVTEINLNSAWRNGTDHRQNDIFGATWYAAKTKAYILDGRTTNLNYFVLMSWDRTQPMAKYGGFGFGMMNSSYPYNPYAPYWTNYLLTRYVPKGSQIYSSKSSDSDLVDILAVESRNSKNMLLINKVNETVNFTLPILGFTIKNATLYFLDRTTYIQKYEPSLNKTIIYRSSIENISLPKDNVQSFIFNGYTVAILEAYPDLTAPYITNITDIDLKSVTWDQNKYYTRAECSGTNTMQVYSNTKPPIVKINGNIVSYDDTLYSIPSWNYDESNKIITIKFSC